VYQNKEEVAEVKFFDFMYNHIRKYKPAHYKGLVSDWPALNKWDDPNYISFLLGNELVDGIHYKTGHPFRNFAGGHVFTN